MAANSRMWSRLSLGVVILTAAVISVPAGAIIQTDLFGARPVSSWEARSVLGGSSWDNERCQQILSNCPNGTVPTTETQCAPQTIAGCTISSCTSCTSAPTAGYQACVTHPDTNCIGGGAACGGFQSSVGCRLTTVPATSCSCPGGYVPTTTNCSTSSCTGTQT